MWSPVDTRQAHTGAGKPLLLNLARGDDRRWLSSFVAAPSPRFRGAAGSAARCFEPEAAVARTFHCRLELPVWIGFESNASHPLQPTNRIRHDVTAVCGGPPSRPPKPQGSVPWYERT